MWQLNARRKGKNNKDSDKDDTWLESVEKVRETLETKAGQSALVEEKVLMPAETDQ